MSETVTVRVEHMSDWHAYITCPKRGELGYCLEHGGDTIDPDTLEPDGELWDPATATAVLARHGWHVVGEWRDAPDDAEHQYEADARQAG